MDSVCQDLTKTKVPIQHDNVNWQSATRLLGIPTAMQCTAQTVDGRRCMRIDNYMFPFCKFHLESFCQLRIATSKVNPQAVGLYTLIPRATNDFVTFFGGDRLTMEELVERYEDDPDRAVFVYEVARRGYYRLANYEGIVLSEEQSELLNRDSDNRELLFDPGFNLDAIYTATPVGRYLASGISANAANVKVVRSPDIPSSFVKIVASKPIQAGQELIGTPGMFEATERVTAAIDEAAAREAIDVPERNKAWLASVQKSLRGTPESKLEKLSTYSSDLQREIVTNEQRLKQNADTVIEYGGRQLLLFDPDELTRTREDCLYRQDQLRLLQENVRQQQQLQQQLQQNPRRSTRIREAERLPDETEVTELPGGTTQSRKYKIVKRYKGEIDPEHPRVSCTTRCKGRSPSGEACRRECETGRLCKEHTAERLNVVIRDSTLPGAGSGLFAYKPGAAPDEVIFRPGGKEIVEYTGDRIDDLEVRRRYGYRDEFSRTDTYSQEKKGKMRTIKTEGELVEVRRNFLYGKDAPYLYRLPYSSGLEANYIDAIAPDCSPARYINDCVTAPQRCNARLSAESRGGQVRVFVYPTTDIKQDEEILVSYTSAEGSGYWKGMRQNRVLQLDV